ncbi:malonyl-ACP O-methyltransferase BioC [[Haemophilus] ducreyi]|uniref:malonyl-ACP O-methyltransferase BioC n=1 Tax=Haemophilus ducreyi TaxID=730 RepID=UPI0006555175|nr:malonyl-ACP O-methyltransferase BioC [[Haemophilus] ducreyi]AKO45778.1 malonyl-CoA O-methyltransferase [[Haemophilus] ducreyi]AKO47165.1 malonyl-CoA O-methyltransferase [[Haemophilus] ducreyi]AKO48527.1 malonyl-CoA O-methyltransferase [[Haemophilus] ducreyi]AKO49897.1 malonyl-CoA O-methyltransferase [[Haemophilus] ducreyi]ANF62394.1 malonyl-[acyl-carrier protein] O-methyltransferase BioC [[Haemophilus] ducreyi]
MAKLAKQLIAKRFVSHLTEYDQYAIAQQQINHQLVDLLQANTDKTFQRALEIGCGTGDLTEKLLAKIPIEHLTLNDFNAIYYPTVLQKIKQKKPLVVVDFMQGDAEQLVFTRNFDLVSAASVVQWFDNPQQFLRNSADALKPGGVVLFNSFSPLNLQEIRQLTGIGLNYPTRLQWQEWLAQDFEQCQLIEQPIKLTFDSPLAVLIHLKKTGVTAVSNKPWNRHQIKQFCMEYQAYFACEQGVYLTYTPILMLGIKKNG